MVLSLIPIHSLFLTPSLWKTNEKNLIPSAECDGSFRRTTNLWIYKCDKCWFYTHLACATSKGKSDKNPQKFRRCRLTLTLTPQESSTPINFKYSSDHITKPSSSSSRRKLVHNPMKKIELLCNGCVRPITSTPFTCVPMSHATLLCMSGAPDYPIECKTTQATLTIPFFSYPLPPISIWTYSDVVFVKCNGFAYSCLECIYHTDVSCAFILEKIRHEAHLDHIIWITGPGHPEGSCRSCLRRFWYVDFSYRCHDCDIGLHVGCALFLPLTIRHRFDKHPLKLSYLPIENRRSLYFCEICEEQFDPKYWFYHCYECGQSIHCACAPLILECEKALGYYSPYMYPYLNIKFGSMHNIEDHPHPLSFVLGTHKDGHCHKCKQELWRLLILKCLQCTFAIHFRCHKSQ
ncbi:LOW QUALITY PROTEIN: hypothetical protein OSB04_021122 [Centaurea solstitialis]|uniref:Phorbol-ester/DAG-type domain-containing protein n=1 Tax=Centaurea solstitialis TaxID=347529 RepID=A0AA38STL7_9ASTR|nr:LOW QUALITY PROTEIN: hypothetical protein OSB04_021122 [Centaurea solstitialis]